MNVVLVVRLDGHHADGAYFIAALQLVALLHAHIPQAAVADDDVVHGHLCGLAVHLVLRYLRHLAAEHGVYIVAQRAVKVDARVRLPGVEHLVVDALLAVFAQHMPRLGGHTQAHVRRQHGLQRVPSLRVAAVGRVCCGRRSHCLRCGFLRLVRCAAFNKRAAFERRHRHRHLCDGLVDDRHLRFGGGDDGCLFNVRHRAVCGIHRHTNGYQTNGKRRVKADSLTAALLRVTVISAHKKAPPPLVCAAAEADMQTKQAFPSEYHRHVGFIFSRPTEYNRFCGTN